MRTVECAREASFDVVLARGLLTRGTDPGPLLEVVAGRRALLVTTPTVAGLYGGAVEALVRDAAASTRVAVVDLGERGRTMAAVEDVCERAMMAGIDRRGVLVSLGGGACTDVVTVAAQLLRRGVDHVRLPTTLVAQVAVAIGIRGEVDHLGRTGALGVLHPPARVLLDPEPLATLPRGLVADGVAEIARIACVCDAGLFRLLSASVERLVSSRLQTAAGETVIVRAIDATLDQLASNVYEQRSLRRLADVGHTFGPLLEADPAFTGTHGAAVAIDVALSACIAAELGLLSGADLLELVGVLLRAGLPVVDAVLTTDLCAEALAAAADQRGGAPNLVVPTAIGRGTFLRDAAAVLDLVPAALARLDRLASAGSRPAPS